MYLLIILNREIENYLSGSESNSNAAEMDENPYFLPSWT